MKKNTINDLVEKLPDLSDFIFEKIKDSGVSYDDTKGVVGICLKLFAKPITDAYLEKVSKGKLDNYGFSTYMKAGLSQAEKSIQSLELNYVCNLNETIISRIEEQLASFNKECKSKYKIMNFDVSSNPILFYIKELYVSVLTALNIPKEKIDEFRKLYNQSIEMTVKDSFGEEYSSHLDEIRDNWLKNSEIKFLEDMISLRRIGFRDDENFEYKTTYAKWEKVHNFRKNDNEEAEQNRYINLEDKKNFEKELLDINLLVDEYFKDNEENYLNKILFVISDFGKGKSVFMKNFASRLAKEYLNKFEGYFPVYFNLRDYTSYTTEDKLGVIKYYLHSKYGIDISNDYYKKKKFVFLMDGLDESGELSQKNINEVIQNIRKIQELDMSEARKNKIIITSRPINEGLKDNLERYEPFIIKESDTDVSYYISIYGFRKYQFNEFIAENVKKYLKNDFEYSGFSKEVIENLKKDKFDFYEEFINKELLSVGELRRPIFSYMIVQLVVNNLDINSLGKIGIYMSFLNLLTKEAKHYEDKNYKVNLEEEFIFRDTLHSIASLWMLKKSNGEQGALKKLEICSAIKGSKADNISQSKEISCFNFLSHSYFGEEGDTLHFQHQSFAEILLAEYYLKLFIKFALDDNVNIHQIRAYLSLGEPTEQTIQFFKELLQMLKDCSESTIINDDIKNKRKMLAPIIASMAVSKNTKVQSPDIKYTWYKSGDLNNNPKKLPENMIEGWPIKKNEIGKIVKLCQNIMESKGNFIPIKAIQCNSIYENEALFFNEPLENKLMNMDKWLAMLVGNILGTDIESGTFFNAKIEWNIFWDLMKQRQFTNKEASPIWTNKYFNGINFEAQLRLPIFLGGEATFGGFDLSNLNFSNSKFTNIIIENSKLNGTIFNNCVIRNSSLIFCEISFAIFKNVTFIENEIMTGFGDYRFLQNCRIHPFLIPSKVESMVSNNNESGYNNLSENIKISKEQLYNASHYINLLEITLEPLLKSAVTSFKNLILSDFKQYFEIDEDLDYKLKERFENIFR